MISDQEHLERYFLFTFPVMRTTLFWGLPSCFILSCSARCVTCCVVAASILLDCSVFIFRLRPNADGICYVRLIFVSECFVLLK